MPTGPHAEIILRAMDEIDATLCVKLSPPHAERPKTDGVRLSEIGYCTRRIGYQMQGYPAKPKSTGVALTFAIGNFVEDVAVKALEVAGFNPRYVLADQMTVKLNDLQVPNSGHPDGFVTLPGTGTELLLEVKSANARNFDKMKREFVKTTQPEHYAQMQTYMDGTGTTAAFYLVACKNYADVYTEIVPYDPDYTAALYARVEDAWNLAKFGELPAPQYHSSSRQCEWCPFNELCGGKVLAGGSPFIVA